MVIALGYRVQSQVATRFRRWATQRLHEYIQEGFAMDDERLKQGGKCLHLGGKCKNLIDSAELRTFFVIFVQNEAVMMIGRIAEKEKLIKAYESEYSQFVTVYGRRRVGKTFFVRETFNYTFTFEHAGLANSPMKKQLKAWQSSL